MKHTLTIRAMALALVLCLLAAGALPVQAADSISQVANDYAAAVQAGQSQVTFTLPNDDVEGALDQLFYQYPALYHYYDGYRSSIYPDRTDVVLSLRDTHHALADVWVIGSDTELTALLGLGLGEIRQEVYFVTRPGYTVSTEQVSAAFEQLQHGYYLSYMGYDSWAGTYYTRDSITMQDYVIQLKYRHNLSPATVQQWRNETEQVTLQLASSLFAQDMPDYLKVLKIHDWVVNHTRYNIKNMQEMGNHQAYGALVKGSCVCMGYAEAGLVLFQAAGIETRYISGDGTNSAGQTEAHAWNAVKVDGQWYQLDMTWDDPVTNDGSDILRYDYFLLTDSQMGKNHVWDRSTAPVCTGGTWNADKALAAAAQDTGSYRAYNADLLVTQAEALETFKRVLQPVPAPQEPVPVVTEPPVFQEDPVTEAPTSFQPLEDLWTTPGTDPVPWEDPQPEPEKDTPGIGVILGAVVGVVAILVIVVLKRPKGGPPPRKKPDPPIYRPVNFN